MEGGSVHELAPRRSAMQVLAVIFLSLLRLSYPYELRFRCKEGPACVCGARGIQLSPHVEKFTDDYLCNVGSSSRMDSSSGASRESTVSSHVLFRWKTPAKEPPSFSNFSNHRQNVPVRSHSQIHCPSS